MNNQIVVTLPGDDGRIEALNNVVRVHGVPVGREIKDLPWPMLHIFNNLFPALKLDNILRRLDIKHEQMSSCVTIMVEVDDGSQAPTIDQLIMTSFLRQGASSSLTVPTPYFPSINTTNMTSPKPMPKTSPAYLKVGAKFEYTHEIIDAWRKFKCNNGGPLDEEYSVEVIETMNCEVGICGGHYFVKDNEEDTWEVPREVVDQFLIRDAKIKEERLKNLDIRKVFEKVILPQETKDEIVAVLEQHKHKDLIFNTWGLGEQIMYGRGMTMLFYGPPGTGKTLCASVIAEVLGQELAVVDTAAVGSPFQGEMERQLKKIFNDAKEKVIFMDECDGLIQDRTGMGQMLSAENNTLLKCIEQHEGILIMATNRIGVLDAALERRISLIIEFPFPDEETRAMIWKKHLPHKLPMKEVSIEVLAKFPLSGGQIKNVVLSAARYASVSKIKKVTMDDFIRAIKRLQKSSQAFTENKENIPSLQNKTPHNIHNFTN